MPNQDSQPSLGTLNVISGVPTRVGLPLDFILPMLDKLDASAAYNRQKQSELQIGLSNMPTATDGDKAYKDKQSKVVEETFNDINKNNNWAGATPTVINLATKLATDEGLKMISSNTSGLMASAKELKDDKDFNPNYTEDVINYNQLRFKEQGGSFDKDGKPQKFVFWKPSTDLKTDTITKELFERADKLKANEKTFFDIMSTNGYNYEDAFKQMGGSVTSAMQDLFRTKYTKTSKLSSLTEDEILKFNVEQTRANPTYFTKLNEIAKLDHFRTTGKLRAGVEDISTLITNNSPQMKAFAINSSDLFLKDKETSDKIITEYNSLVGKTDAKSIKRATELKTQYETFGKKMSESKELYYQDGIKKVNEAIISIPPKDATSEIQAQYKKESDAKAEQLYYQMNVGLLDKNILSSNLGLAFNKSEDKFDILANYFTQHVFDKGNTLLGNTPLVSPNYVASGYFQLNEDAFNPNSTIGKQKADLERIEQSGQPLSTEQRAILQQYRDNEKLTNQTVLTSFNALNPKDKQEAWGTEYGRTLFRAHPIDMLLHPAQYNLRNTVEGHFIAPNANMMITDKSGVIEQQLKKGKIEPYPILGGAVSRITNEELLGTTDLRTLLMNKFEETQKDVYSRFKNGNIYVNNHPDFKESFETTLTSLKEVRDLKMMNITKYFNSENNHSKVIVPYTTLNLVDEVPEVASLKNNIKSYILSSPTDPNGNKIDLSALGFYTGDKIKDGSKPGTADDSFLNGLHIEFLNSHGASNGKGRLIKITGNASYTDATKTKGIHVDPTKYVSTIIRYDGSDDLYDRAVVANANSQMSYFNRGAGNVAIKTFMDASSQISNNLQVNGVQLSDYINNTVINLDAKPKTSTANNANFNKSDFKVNIGGTPFNCHLHKESINNNNYYYFTVGNGSFNNQYKLTSKNDISVILGTLASGLYGMNNQAREMILDYQGFNRIK